MRYVSFQALHTYTGYLTYVAVRLSISAFVTGISFINFKALLYFIINQFFTVAITILILNCSSSHSFRGESRVRRAKMQPKTARTTEGAKNRSLKNISTKNRLASPTSVTLPRISSQSKASLKRDLRGSRSLRYNRRYRKHFRLGRHSIFFNRPVSRLFLLGASTPYTSIFSHFTRQQVGILVTDA